MGQVLHAPPQSTSDSAPLRNWSSQAAWLQRPSSQRKLLQSSWYRQGLPREQRLGAQTSPQSRSDSRPVTPPSAQVGGAHVSPKQTPDEQSLRTTQLCPASHASHSPPQS